MNICRIGMPLQKVNYCIGSFLLFVASLYTVSAYYLVLFAGNICQRLHLFVLCILNIQVFVVQAVYGT